MLTKSIVDIVLLFFRASATFSAPCSHQTYMSKMNQKLNTHLRNNEYSYYTLISFCKRNSQSSMRAIRHDKVLSNNNEAFNPMFCSGNQYEV
jgi:cell shape-determining protein MreC